MGEYAKTLHAGQIVRVINLDKHDTLKNLGVDPDIITVEKRKFGSYMVKYQYEDGVVLVKDRHEGLFGKELIGFHVTELEWVGQDCTGLSDWLNIQNI